MKKHAAPIIAALLLLLPVLYVGSYLMLVTPGMFWWHTPVKCTHYRYGGGVAERAYWPLEQVDRRIRPDKWIEQGVVG